MILLRFWVISNIILTLVINFDLVALHIQTYMHIHTLCDISFKNVPHKLLAFYEYNKCCAHFVVGVNVKRRKILKDFHALVWKSEKFLIMQTINQHVEEKRNNFTFLIFQNMKKYFQKIMGNFTNEKNINLWWHCYKNSFLLNFIMPLKYLLKLWCRILKLTVKNRLFYNINEIF